MYVRWSVELLLKSVEFSAKVGELNEVPLHLHPSENFRHILNLLKSSSSYLHYYSLGSREAMKQSWKPGSVFMMLLSSLSSKVWRVSPVCRYSQTPCTQWVLVSHLTKL